MPNAENILPHRFKPGESGNPGGRPKGSRNVQTVIQEALFSDVDWTDIEGKPARLACIDAIVIEQMRKAMAGDTAAFNAVMDRGYGKPCQALEVNKDEGPQKFVVEYVGTKSDNDLKGMVEELKERLSKYEPVDDIQTTVLYNSNGSEDDDL